LELVENGKGNVGIEVIKVPINEPEAVGHISIEGTCFRDKEVVAKRRDKAFVGDIRNLFILIVPNVPLIMKVEDEEDFFLVFWQCGFHGLVIEHIEANAALHVVEEGGPHGVVVVETDTGGLIVQVEVDLDARLLGRSQQTRPEGEGAVEQQKVVISACREVADALVPCVVEPAVGIPIKRRTILEAMHMWGNRCFCWG
jgi:hypothetical protein